MARGKEVPPYEKDDATVELLHQLVVEMETSNENAKLELADLSQQEVEYRAEGVESESGF
jgi:hypothetical protein